MRCDRCGVLLCTLQVVAEKEVALEEARTDLQHEAAKSMRYKRAFSEIDSLVSWARTLPTSARGKAPGQATAAGWARSVCVACCCWSQVTAVE